MKKQVILLNGPSSSGKSTLAKALQALIEERMNENYAIVSIDDYLKFATDEAIYEDDVFAISGTMCEKVLQVLEYSPGVIIDHVITSERIFRQLTAKLGQHRILFVHVTCPLKVLQKREQERKNRCLGSAEASTAYLFPKDGYDVTVDSHRMSPTECSGSIYDALL